jgi:glucosamine 6-phosphate synthetase-like amidotransferase/phosphosugar isomerase protein
MCAIIASRDILRFANLLEKNKDRGTFASSFVDVCGKDITICKRQGLISEGELFAVAYKHEEPSFFIGHVQSPTSAAREFDEKTSHPFCSDDWIVFHNGVLTNHKELSTTCIVDTEVIRDLLQSFYFYTKDETACIKSMCREIKGTFALFIINKNTGNMYILRQGSILHYSDNGDVSTLKVENTKKLPEGKIMRFENNIWDVCEVFETSSPFLFI